MSIERNLLYDIIRWHFYDDLRGYHSADPSCNGIQSEDLWLSIKSIVGSVELDRLKAEGEMWAEFELNSRTNDKVQWSDVPDFKHGDKVEISKLPQPPES